MTQPDFTITEASKLYNKQRATLYRHIKQGKLSCTIASDDSKRISLAELIRVYGEAPSSAEIDARNDTRSIKHSDTSKDTQSETVNRLLNELQELRESEKRAWETALEAKNEALAVYQRLLDPPAGEKGGNKPKWWQFWK